MVKRIIRDDEKKDQEETQDYQRSILSILDPRHSKQPLQKFKVPDFRNISVILTAPHRYSSSLDILSSSFGQESRHCFLVIYCLSNVFQWKHFCYLLKAGFFLFFELLDYLATHITWLSGEDPVELYQHHFMDLSNTAWARKDLTKQTVRSKSGSYEHNSYSKYWD